MELNWVGSFSQGQGYSGSAEGLIIALKELGVSVYPMTFSKTPLKNLTDAGRRIKSEVFRVCDVGIAYGFPNSFSSLMHNRRKIGFTMFETTKMPSGVNEWAGRTGDWLGMLEGLEMLLAPSQYCKILFEAEGAKLPIRVVPLGVNPMLYRKMERPRRKKFIFLMLGTLTMRKYPGAVLGAFLDLYKNRDDVELILKTQDGTLGHITMPYKNVKIIDRRATPEEIISYYRDSDCFVFPSRGEGFGLPPLEAMATGMPVIFPAHTGMADFADDRYGYVLRKWTREKAIRFPKTWGNVGEWFTPDFHELKAKMKYVVENREEARQKGLAAADWVAENWTYKNSAQKLIQTIWDI